MSFTLLDTTAGSYTQLSVGSARVALTADTGSTCRWSDTSWWVVLTAEWDLSAAGQIRLGGFPSDLPAAGHIRLGGWFSPQTWDLSAAGQTHLGGWFSPQTTSSTLAVGYDRGLIYTAFRRICPPPAIYVLVGGSHRRRGICLPLVRYILVGGFHRKRQALLWLLDMTADSYTQLSVGSARRRPYTSWRVVLTADVGSVCRWSDTSCFPSDLPAAGHIRLGGWFSPQSGICLPLVRHILAGGFHRKRQALLWLLDMTADSYTQLSVGSARRRSYTSWRVVLTAEWDLPAAGQIHVGGWFSPQTWVLSAAGHIRLSGWFSPQTTSFTVAVGYDCGLTFTAFRRICPPPAT
ncbi:hypothetical protein B0H10DRAFT_2223750 [Mycena sp. CBHHK59/15]|nr:hypothetical protein B0H10DRAFT_2223750 [Mycena sp. CBHHK59/15]